MATRGAKDEAGADDDGAIPMSISDPDMSCRPSKASKTAEAIRARATMFFDDVRFMFAPWVAMPLKRHAAARGIKRLKGPDQVRKWATLTGQP
jgi:hypothetical protein